MRTHVYANTLEIACKAEGSDGKTISAFPDPCWSPPGPAAGPIVIPYPNTVFAKDITNGTSTVFIAGQQVAIEDKSYFSTSTGNEPATQAFAKGLATGVIKGKAYFKSWSFDVKFEGLGVARHTDLTSHNHGSMPGNTPLFPYIANKLINNPCNKEQEAIERACKPEHKQSDTQKDLRKHSKVGELLKKVRMPGKSKKREKGWHWTDDHCDGLQVALVDPADAMAYMKKMEEIGKKLPSELEALAKIRPMLVDLAVNAGTEAAAKWAAKAAAKQLAGSSVPAWGNAVMAIWSVVDGVMAIGDVAEIKAVASAALSQLDVLKSKIDNLQALAKRFEGFSSLDKKAQEAEALALATDAQDALATLNPCVRARKCNLVPHTQNENSRNVEPADSGGCCDGQTGHHLVSGAAMEEACRTNYKHPTAPTVCVEGTSWHKGSHKRAHVAYAKETDDAPKDKDGRMSMEDTMNAAAESHKRAFPLSACDKDCIMAQLRAYYGAKCAAAKPYAANDQGKLVIPQIGTVNR